MGAGVLHDLDDQAVKDMNGATPWDARLMKNFDREVHVEDTGTVSMFANVLSPLCLE